MKITVEGPINMIANHKITIEGSDFQYPSTGPVPLYQLLDYEIRASWWASWISARWMQNLAGKYYGWKVCRKYRRYKWSKDVQQYGI